MRRPAYAELSLTRRAIGAFNIYFPNTVYAAIGRGVAACSSFDRFVRRSGDSFIEVAQQPL